MNTAPGIMKRTLLRRGLRVLSLTLALVLAAAILPGARFDSAQAAPSGMMRVLLTRLGSLKTMKMKLNGSYSLNGNASKVYPRGTQATVTLDGGALYLTVGSDKQKMGASFKLMRHKTSGDNGIQFETPKLSNLFAGDLFLSINSGAIRPVLNIQMEDYLKGVVAYEMNNSYPLEALKAQAVAARTFAVQRQKAATAAYDLTDTSTDQVFKGLNKSYTNVIRAVDETAGMCVRYGGKYASGWFAASNGGQTEIIQNAWGNSSGLAYIVMKDDPYDLENPASTVKSHSVPKDPAKKALNSKLEGALKDALSPVMKGKELSGAAGDIKITRVKSITPQTPRFKAPSRTFTELKFVLDVEGKREGQVQKLEDVAVVLKTFDKLEALLDLSINSGKNEMIYIREADSAFTIEFRRWGHGVGMSQRGAQWMAKQYGKSYKDILTFYYPGVTIEKTNFPMEMLGAGQSAPVATPKPTAAPTAKPSAYKALKYGMKNSADVKKLQQRLKDLGFFTGIPAGNYLEQTQTAVAAFQKAAGLKVDGKNASVAMQEKLFSSTAPRATAKPTAKPTVKPTAKPTVKPTVKPTAKPETGVAAKVVLKNKKSTVALRKSASTSSAKLATLKHGAKVKITGTKGAWKKVTYSGKTGYVQKQYLQLITPTGTVKLASKTGAMNIRQSASTSSKSLGKLKHGEKITLIKKKGAWYQIRNKAGKVGYVKTIYVKLDDCAVVSGK